jgi:high-affinity iron transporter
VLATFVIGLREGLEAALIVGIIAAFLKTNGRRLTAMWIGVGLALALSVAVGVVLSLIEAALPQAAQEGMETVIGGVAVFFVTGMIVWMNSHSRAMRSELEGQASEALRDGHAYALAVMAFLAVLKEGFETSVFLLATFSAATSAGLAALGAVLGVLVAVGIGIGIYAGGVRINLSRFFRITGAFLILVAAGLVMTMLRTAHEAGWLTGGQQPTVDLSWLVAPGSISAALITGVLGIPADPRVVEVVGWLLYLVPVSLFVYWPRAHRLAGRSVAVLQASIGAAAAVAAVLLAVVFAAVPAPSSHALSLVRADGQTAGTARLVDGGVRFSLAGRDPVTEVLDPAAAQSEHHAGVTADSWRTTGAVDATAPATLTLDQLVALSGGRIPIGLDPRTQPGPYDAAWHVTAQRTVWVSDGVLLDAAEVDRTVVTLSGGGLTTPRTVTVSGSDPTAAAPAGWRGDADQVRATSATLQSYASFQVERSLWGIQFPVVLAVAALVLFAFAGRSARRAAAASAPVRRPATASVPAQRSTVHASR